MNTTSANSEIRTAAQQWFARLLAPDCSDFERATFNRWRAADPQHEAAYREVEAVWERSASMHEDPAIAAALKEALRPPMRRSTPRRRSWWAAFATAASVAVGVVLLLRVFAPPENIPAVRYATVLGEQRTIALADGSQVVLDTNTELLVQLGERERNLTLQHGQVDFKVRHDTDRPFVVHAGGGSVTATGTQFQVRVTDDGSMVTLLEGQVVVASRAQEFNRSTLEPGERITIEASGQFGRLYRVSGSDLANARGWIAGDLVVKEWPLETVVAEMNRYSSTKLRLGDPALGSVPISGVFKAGDQKSFALALEYGWSVHADQRTTASEIVLTRK